MNPPALTELTLRHPAGVTPILVGADALSAARPRLAAWLAGRTVFVVTSPRVFALHGARLSALASQSSRWEVLEVPEGEPAKSVATAERLWNEMLARGGKRDSRVVAFGGGSVGDLAGFAAGCFLRGIDFVQLPTTLLAQVDAAVGGKTGVDLPGGKNTVGLFHHPALVVCDTALLGTLPPAEVRSGLVEAAKMAALLDPALFARLEERLEPLLAADAGELAPVVAGAVAAKAGVVERDPTEQDERRLLNFGHTLGHALETAGAYQGLRHGEAVAYGVLFALRLARSRGADPDLLQRIPRLLSRLGLPPLPTMNVEQLTGAMARDKKARESGLVWVLPRGWGQGWMAEGIGGEEIRRELAAFLQSPWAT